MYVTYPFPLEGVLQAVQFVVILMKVVSSGSCGR